MTNFPNDPFSQANYSSGTMYAQSGGYEIEPPAKTSFLAIVTLIFGILGFLICWAPVIGLVVGALVVFLGIASMLSISASRGRKKGKGLAITGFVLGLLNVLIGVGCVISMGMGGKMIAGYSGALTAAQTGDVNGFNAFTSGNAQLTQAELDAFAASYQAKMGDFKDAPPSFMQVFKVFGSPAAIEEIGSLQQANAGRPMQLLPVAWNFDNGEGLVILLMDPASTSPSAPMGALEDIVIVDMASNTVVTRLSDVLGGGLPILNPDGTLPVRPIPDLSTPVPDAAEVPDVPVEVEPAGEADPASNPS
jgi:hypothetical protein